MNKFSICLALVIISTLAPLVVFATAQIPDRIILDGELTALASNPLDEYFESNPEALPESPITSTGLWRGYIATFVIENRNLYITELVVHDEDPERRRSFPQQSKIDSVFPEKADRRLAWFTGILVVPQGDLVTYEHLGYAQMYEGYLLIRIENGVETERHKLSGQGYEQFRGRQFNKYQMIDRYKNQVRELKEFNKEHGYDMAEEEIDQFMYSVDTWYPTFIMISFRDE